MDLIQRCLAGDEEAFAALFHQYKDLVYKTAYLMLGSTGEAEDVLQEVFLRVHRSLHTFRPARGAFSTWLRRITVNRCLKRRRKRGLLVLSLDEVAPSVLASPTPPPGSQIGENEALLRGLNRLSKKQRTVIILHYYLGLSYAEMAQFLGIPLGTAKSRLSLALKNLRQTLDTTGERAAGPSSSPKEEVSV